MPRLSASLFVAVCLLVGATNSATNSYARGVDFGMAGPSGVVRPGSGFLHRHINFKSLAAPGVVFVPCDDPYAVYPAYPLDPSYVALLWELT
jgi:hypothetical protein